MATKEIRHKYILTIWTTAWQPVICSTTATILLYKGITEQNPIFGVMLSGIGGVLALLSLLILVKSIKRLRCLSILLTKYRLYKSISNRDTANEIHDEAV